MSAPLLHARRCGRGTPVVLLHGWGMNLGVFGALQAGLARHHTVCAIDLPGHGRSPWRTALTHASQLQWLQAGIPRGAALVGWSLGGQLALQLAAEPSLEIERLVLIGSTPRFVRGADWPHGLPSAQIERFARQVQSDRDAAWREFLALQTHACAQAGTILQTLQRALRLQGEARSEALALGLDALRTNDLRELAGRLRQPALLISGQLDRVTPPGALRALAGRMRRARLLELPRAGHALIASHRRELLPVLLAFLSANRMRSARSAPAGRGNAAAGVSA